MPGARLAIREAAPGVLVHVDYSNKRAILGTANGQALPRDEILAALKSIHYSGQWVEE